jgi:Putative Ig domain
MTPQASSTPPNPSKPGPAVVLPPGPSPTASGAPAVTAAAPAHSARLGQPFDQAVFPEATYSVIKGILPAGLALDPTTGHVSGRPTAPGRADVQIQSVSPKGTEVHDFSVNVA